MRIIANEHVVAREIANLVARRKRGYSLEAPLYLDDDVLDFDMKGIFGRHWIHVGAAPEVPEAGDYITIDMGNYSLIVIRGDDMKVRAFHNVCRHRGSRILMEPKGSLRKFVCRYHNWTYDLTGALCQAEHIAPDVERDCLGFKPVHLRDLCGLIFVCLADEPPADFDEMQRIVEPYLAPHRLDACKIAHRIDLVEDGNWKTVMENNRECYHCGRHPELMKTFFQFFAHAASDVKPRQKAYYERYKRIQGELIDIWNTLGLPWNLVEHLDRRATAFRVERLALDNRGESYTFDTAIASKRLVGDFTVPRLGALSLHTQPNSWNHFLSDHAVIFSVFPLAPERTLVRTTWFVHKDAVEGKDYDLDNLTRVWRKTNEQDATFVGWSGAGVRSAGYEPGPYSPNENQVEKFLDWYIERMAAYLDERLASPALPPMTHGAGHDSLAAKF